MKLPDIKCIIKAQCIINPSEDITKVKQAVSNVILNSKITITDDFLNATSHELESLEKIYMTIHSRHSIRNYRRQLRNNTSDSSTWFYLNRQAAYANVIALCAEADESPLGPIKVILNSYNIEKIIDWLAPYDKES